MICACSLSASGLACEAMAIVASTCPLCTAAIMFGTCCTGRRADALHIEMLRLGDAADHVMKRRAILRDGEAVPGQLVRRCQAGIERLVRYQDRRACITLLLVHGAADHFQRALLREVEEPSGQRGHADIDVAGHRCRGDRLRGFKEAERQVDALVAKVAAFLRDIERRGESVWSRPRRRGSAARARVAGVSAATANRPRQRRRPRGKVVMAELLELFGLRGNAGLISHCELTTGLAADPR